MAETNTEAAPEPYGAVSLFNNDSAVIFRTDRGFEIISENPKDAPITEQLFMCLLVKSFLSNKELVDSVAKTLIADGTVSPVPGT